MAGKYLLKDKKSNQWVARSGKNANDLFYYFTERRDEALHFSTTAEIEAEKARMKSLGFKTDVFDVVDESATYQKKRFKEPYYMYKESKKIIKEDAPQKIVIKNAWGVEVKDYKAGDPIPAGAKFKIFNAKDPDKIEAYADSLFESKKVVENKMVGIISLPVGCKFIDDSFGGKRTMEVVKHGDDDVVHVREVGTGRKFAYDASTPGGNKKVEKIEEGRIAKGYENLTADERAKHLLSHPTSKYMSDLKSENITERAIRKAVKEMLGKPDKDDPIFIQDVEEGCIKESAYYIKSPHGFYVMKTDNAYDLTDDKEKALKYSNGNDAAKELTYIHKYSPDSRLKKIMVVQEEGEGVAPATSTANVANPELPIKLKEDKEISQSKLKVGDTWHLWASSPEFWVVTKVDNDYIYSKNKKTGETTQTPKNSKFVVYLSESLSSKSHKFKPEELKIGKKFTVKSPFYKNGSRTGKIMINHNDLYGNNPYTPEMKGSTKITIQWDDTKRSEDVDPNDFGGDEFILEDADALENHIKYQTSVAGGMGTDAQNAESAKEHEEETTLIESIIKKVVKKKLTESAGQKLNITLIRKPQNMKEVERDMRKGYGDRVKAVVDKSYNLSGSEYDKFVYNFMVHTTYLSGEGGVDPDGTVHVIEITGPNRKTIYVDPEGYDYARYVGW